MIGVKICGLNDAAGVEAALAGGAGWIGLNFFDRSPRHVTPAQAASLVSGLPPTPLRVGLFVDPADSALADTLRAVKLDVLQIYAPAARLADIRARFGVPVWRSVHVTVAADLPADAGEDGFVIEPRPPAGATRPGGNAAVMDWSLLAGWRAPKPWLLAGGLRPDNVAAAIAASGATAVDVSSGVESAPGVKSPALIRAFIAAARSSPLAAPAAASPA